MKQWQLFLRTRIFAVLLGIVCVSLTSLAFWNAAAFHSSSPLKDQSNSASNKLREGLGSEVRFSAASASSEEIRASVESAASFIAARSGLVMSEETRAELETMEQQTLKGGHARIGIGEFTNALTDTLVERISALTDQDINFASTVLKVNANGGIMLRATGKFYATAEEFDQQAKAFRDPSRKNDKALRASVDAVLREEVQGRMKFLGEGMPEQFGNAPGLGLTPLQALLVAYSVVADDYLEFSQTELQKIVKSPASIKGDPHGRIPQNGRAYGPFGRLFSTPANLVFNKTTVSSLLGHFQKGGN